MASKSTLVLTILVSVMFAASSFAQSDTTLDNGKPIIKVFTLQNRDVTELTKTLNELFSSEDEAALLRVGKDERTNSIIVTGPQGDVEVVSNLVKRLDKVPGRKKINVIRLQNSAVQDVATAINNWLKQKHELFGVEQHVSIESEVASNSLIVSSSQTDKEFERLIQMIAELDRRPPMVQFSVVVTRLVNGKTTSVSKPMVVNSVGNLTANLSLKDGDGELKISVTPRVVTKREYRFTETARDNSPIAIFGESTFFLCLSA